MDLLFTSVLITNKTRGSLSSKDKIQFGRILSVCPEGDFLNTGKGRPSDVGWGRVSLTV